MCASVCMTVFPQLHNYIEPLCNNYIQCYGSATLHSVPCKEQHAATQFTMEGWFAGQVGIPFLRQATQ